MKTIDTNEVLNELINAELEKLRGDNLNSEERKEVEDNLLKLIKFRDDGNNKKIDIQSDKKFQYLKLGVEVASIVLPLTFYGIWMNKGLKFEETGTFTSSTFKGLAQKFKPTK